MGKVIECCVNCKYWDCYDEDGVKNGKISIGECHRYPPSVQNFEETEKLNIEGVTYANATMILVRNTPLLSHPFTFDEDWCGEFRAVDNPTWIDDEED